MKLSPVANALFVEVLAQAKPPVRSSVGTR